ncbi:Xaa-Pro aminopeptidase [Thiomicrorhabdus immobilis]|uniref:Xaa-Pro aminopeptidase n=1 Tax=Thiomicrorhabdus immobilis TaxID=2791037 RepID=A0ABM7ME06_9GAMM|nr:aminopeptidase P N-terminal domain-containing protein [Thiomicrorhabdus immobilis]BCN93638.1 Xaa-Pro aminopeptidase [Thiomicrorhabdus immobilis]
MSSFYSKNRDKLFNQLPDNSLAIIASGEEHIRNRDVEFAFRAESDFFYLTGFSEPDSVLFLIKQQQNRAALFLRPKDPEQETWQGRRLGVESACKTLQVDQAWSIEELDEQAVVLLENIDSVFVSFAHLPQWSESINSWIAQLKQKVRKGISAPSQIRDLDKLLHEMRVFKSAEEIKRMRRAAQISVKGHLAAMRAVLSSDYEYQVQAALEAEFMQQGSPRVAFNSIVASAENACILHYTENRSKIDRNALVLVDAGAEVDGYAGDITTTFPASGTFSDEQASLYSLVLKAQQAAIKVIKPGVSYDSAHQATLKVLTTGLVELGILQGSVDELIAAEAYKAFFMHGTGHWLGMDVHDVGEYKINQQWRDFEPGMVVTVEPGLYISAEHRDVDAKWHNIGIRIEDDVLVTENGNEVLTFGLPRTVAEIESWMATHR